MKQMNWGLPTGPETLFETLFVTPRGSEQQHLEQELMAWSEKNWKAP